MKKLFIIALTFLSINSFAEYYTVIKQEGRKVTIDGNMGELKPGMKVFLEGSSIPVKVIGIKDEMTIIEVPPTGVNFQNRERISLNNPRTKKNRTENKLNGGDLTLTEPLYDDSDKKHTFVARNEISSLNYFLPIQQTMCTFNLNSSDADLTQTLKPSERKIISANLHATELVASCFYGFKENLIFGIEEGYLTSGKTQYKNETNNSKYPELSNGGISNPTLYSKYRVLTKNNSQNTYDVGLSVKPRLIPLKSYDGVTSSGNGNNGDSSYSFTIYNDYGYQTGISDLLLSLYLTHYFAGKILTNSAQTDQYLDPYNNIDFQFSWRMHINDFFIGPKLSYILPFNITSKFSKNSNPYTVTDIYGGILTPAISAGIDFSKKLSFQFTYEFSNYDYTSMVGNNNQTIEISNGVSQSAFLFALKTLF